MHIDDLSEQRLCPREIARGKLFFRQPELDLRQELIRGKKALEAISLDAVRVGDDHRRRPLRAESLKSFRVLLDVVFYRYEVLVDEVADLRVGVNLGVQPSASPSHRSGAEIEKKGFVLFRRLMKGGIDVFVPGNGHNSLLLSVELSAPV